MKKSLMVIMIGLLCLSAFSMLASRIKAVEPPISATVDMGPDKLNLRSRGSWTNAYIELPPDYDVNNIVVSSILLNGTVPVDPSAPTLIGDYDSDGIPDLMVNFNRTDLSNFILSKGVIYGDVDLNLTGKLIDNTPFEGHDTIKVSSLAGDVNCDGTVNILDISAASGIYGSKDGDPNWNPNANFAPLYDVINIFDLITCIYHYGQVIP
jgi:hypothetical protein